MASISFGESLTKTYWQIFKFGEMNACALRNNATLNIGEVLI